MKYFLDTEFHKYHKQQKCFGIKVGKPIPTIDLISIGIVSEDGREYYAISKDFNIKDAWYSYQFDKNGNKVYWLRENVLKPIFKELLDKELVYCYKMKQIIGYCNKNINDKFTLRNFAKLVKKYGKTNKQIAEEIKIFVYYTGWEADPPVHSYKLKEELPIEFYTYYGDYDWVVFTQLFGEMIDLPKHFPMYCKGLKQMLDEKAKKININDIWFFDDLGEDGYCFMNPVMKSRYIKASNLEEATKKLYNNTLMHITKINDFSSDKLDIIKNMFNYPEQVNEHNALNDARWNKKLYKFLKNL